MTPTMTRRTFLKTTALGLTGLTLGCTLDPWPPDVKSSNVTVWINISEDNQITIIAAKAEMGQGVSTALPCGQLFIVVVVMGFSGWTTTCGRSCRAPFFRLLSQGILIGIAAPPE